MEFLSALPEPLVTIAAILGFIVTGVFALATIWDRTRNQKIKNADEADNRLVSILQKTVTELEKKVKILEDSDIKKQELMVGLKAKNELLEKLFQGRDPETKEFQRAGFEAIKKTDVILKQQTVTNTNIERLAIAIERYLSSVGTPLKTLKEETTKVTTVE